MARILMVEKDLRPVIIATLKREDGSIVDLTGCSVKFHMKKGDVKLIEKSASILNPPTDGKVQYAWEAGDTDVTGTCYGEFEVTFADAKEQSFPSEGDFKIIFREEYA